ncbi:hypothetical protein K8I61_18775 [bacterium]|nr:hypothetical protein [bacterium]
MPTRNRTAFVFAAVVCFATGFFAVDAHAQGTGLYPIGERASGMGGAYIGLANDASGGWYNPAGLAYADSLRFSLTGTAYGYARITYENAFKFGKIDEDLESREITSHPTSFGTVYRFDSLKFSDPGPQRDALGFSIVVPDYFYFRDLASFDSDRHVLSVTEESKTYWAGPSYARRIRHDLSIGATLFGLLGQERYRSYWTGKLDEDSFDVLEDELSLSAYSEENRLTFGALVLGGIRYVFAPWSVGAIVRSPSMQLYGEGDSATDIFVGYQDEHDLDQEFVEFEPKREDPLLVGGGIAYEKSRRFTISADVLYTAGASYKDADKDSVASDVKLKAVTDVRAGVEYYVTKSVPLRAGFFTDFAQEDTDEDNQQTSVDLYGLTLAGGIRHSQYTFNLGVNYVFGDGTTFVPAVTERGGEIVDEVERTSVTAEAISLVISTSYRFGTGDE